VGSFIGAHLLLLAGVLGLAGAAMPVSRKVSHETVA
jgi:hypothetical protein